LLTKAIYILYRTALAAGSPIILTYFLIRAVRNSAYWQTLPERLGFLPRSYSQTGSGAIWLHAVSVGEVLSAAELLRRLREAAPETPLFVSTATLAGRSTADNKLKGLADGVFYAPIDYVWIVRRVLRRLRPAAVVVAETEIWPNLFREARRHGCGLLVINGRISDVAAPSYIRHRWFFRHVLCWPERILAQSEEIRGRYLASGAPEVTTENGGNLKYDLAPGDPPAGVLEWLDRVRPGRIWIAASTMPPNEDDLVIATFGELSANYPDLLLILAPRKPDLFEEAARKLAAAGVHWGRRSALPESLELPAVLLLDSIGELASLFALGDVVFMGGSIVPRGGHNILEPAYFGKPVITGPHMENFREIDEAFRRAGAVVRIGQAAELTAAVDRLMSSREEAARVGEAARECAEARRGATDRAVAAILESADGAVPVFPPPFPLWVPLWLLSKLWMAGSGLKRWWVSRRPARLAVPIVSVGNLSMGGSGKTPMVLHLAARLPSVGILTRGYRRETSDPVLVCGPGDHAPVEATGDEAQLFLQSGLAPVGIGPDRAAVGRCLLERFPVSTLVLDDGFQHWRLHRDVDIVLIDGLDPLAGGSLFPLGRLREPLPALSRADILVITRRSRPAPGLERELRRYCPGAPIFYARVKPLEWVGSAPGIVLPPKEFAGRTAAAFCGLANPDSFWRTLSSLGIRPEPKWVYSDHHRYHPSEIASMAEAGAPLLTTAKDAVKIGHPPANLYWLRIEMEISEEDRFLNAIRRKLEG